MKSEQVVIRIANKAHLRSLRRKLLKEDDGFIHSWDFINLAQERKLLHVAVQGKAVVGFAMPESSRNRSIWMLWVSAARRKEGIGTKLVLSLEKKAGDQGDLSLEVINNAHRFWMRFDYVTKQQFAISVANIVRSREHGTIIPDLSPPQEDRELTNHSVLLKARLVQRVRNDRPTQEDIRAAEAVLSSSVATVEPMRFTPGERVVLGLTLFGPSAPSPCLLETARYDSASDSLLLDLGVYLGPPAGVPSDACFLAVFVIKNQQCALLVKQKPSELPGVATFGCEKALGAVVNRLPVSVPSDDPMPYAGATAVLINSLPQARGFQMAAIATLNRVVDDIMDGNGKFTFSPDDLELSLSSQLQKVVSFAANGDARLPLSLTVMYALLMVKHHQPDVREYLPEIGFSNRRYRRNYEAEHTKSYRMAQTLFRDKIQSRVN